MTREEDIRNAIETMRKGGVILYPTDTVWGIGCDATNAEAVKRVYEIKQRDDSKALICLVDSDARMQRYFRHVPDVAWQLIDSLKEGDAKPTTLILDGAINLAENLIAEDGSLGVRITNEPSTWQRTSSLRTAVLVYASPTNLSPRNSVFVFRRPSYLPLLISAENQPHRTTVTSTSASSTRWITSAGAVVRNISPIPPQASSN